MGTVRIESINKDKKFEMEIESDSLYAINCLAGKNVELLDIIREICIAEDIILIRTEDRDFRNGCQSASYIKDNREENNVNAYDWQGNHLWNIGELVGDIKMAFDSITYITSSEAISKFRINPMLNARCLFRCVSGGFAFFIDAKNKKVLCKAVGKARQHYLPVYCYPFTGANLTESTAFWSMTQDWGQELDSKVISYSNGVNENPKHRYEDVESIY